MSTKPSEPIKPKPCPFCESKKIDISHGMTGAPFLFFKCRECGAVVSFDNGLTNRFPEIAMANWNKRAQHNISDADMKAAAEALAYRTPKKPESKNYHFGGMFLPACPTCGEFLEDEMYCPSCGQAIKWEDYDGES